jgi:DNA polymerase II small subunit
MRGMKKGILKRFAENGMLVDPEAIEILEKDPEAMKRVDMIVKDADNRPLVLTKADLDEYIQGGTGAGAVVTAVEQPTIRGDGGIRVLKDVTGKSTCVGNVMDFAKLFNDRFVGLSRILSKRRELAGAIPISKAKRVQRDVRVIGIVYDAHFTKKGHTLVELEDGDDRMQVLVMKGALRPRESILKDEIIGVVGSFSKDGQILVAKDLIRPDVPVNSSMPPMDTDSLLAFVSDLHTGSTTFLPDAWARFVHWLKSDAVARDIKYIVMPGDLVEGIGVYPDQEEELSIDDIYGQYMHLSELLGDIPDWVKLVLMPGNHDAVRLAEPQPALPEEIRDMFDSNVVFAGNPCYLEIEDRTILAYHGYSIHDFLSNCRDLSWSEPVEVMKGMLKRRHLAPVYGEKTGLAPEQKDYLLIDRVPNIFVTGHVHACGIGEYRGIKLVNASTWQAQTSFQRMQNIQPDPAKVPIIELGTGEMWVEDFSR